MYTTFQLETSYIINCYFSRFKFKNGKCSRFTSSKRFELVVLQLLMHLCDAVAWSSRALIYEKNTTLATICIGGVLEMKKIVNHCSNTHHHVRSRTQAAGCQHEPAEWHRWPARRVSHTERFMGTGSAHLTHLMPRSTFPTFFHKPWVPRSTLPTFWHF